jgi:hypothetical protein
MQRDLAPISLIVTNVEVLVVNPANPASSVTDFVAQSAQDRPDADRLVRVGNAASGAQLLADSPGLICCTFRTKARRRRSLTGWAAR